MSLKSRQARFTAAGAAVALTALAAAAAPANAAETASGTLNYTCTVPIIGDQPVVANVTTNIPLTWPAGQLTPQFEISVDARAKGDTYLGLQIVGAAPGGSLEGKGKAPNQTNGGVTNARLVFPNTSGGTSTLGLTIPITIPKTTVPNTDPGAGGLAIPASGLTPKVSFPAAGTAQIFVDGIALSLLAKDAGGVAIEGLGDPSDSDADPLTFDLPCTGPSVKLADITVTGGGGATPVPTPVETPAPATPTPTPPPTGPTIVNYGYAIAGNAVLKGLTSGTIAVSGTGKYALTLQTGAFTGTTKLNPSSAKLQAVRLLPVTAQIAFTEVGSTTGTLKDLTLVANTKQSIQLKNVKVFGINLVTNTCRTVSPSAITLKSATGQFKPTSGGTITGSFAISQLTSCGALNGIVSGLTAGSGNGIAVKLTPSN